MKLVAGERVEPVASRLCAGQFPHAVWFILHSSSVERYAIRPILQIWKAMLGAMKSHVPVYSSFVTGCGFSSPQIRSHFSLCPMYHSAQDALALESSGKGRPCVAMCVNLTEVV